MDVHHWFLFGGIFLLAMVLGEKWLKDGPVSSAIIYLLLGLLLGPKFFNVLNFDILKHPEAMETGAEIVVLISLFSVGLKLQAPLRHALWKVSAILASATMIFTVAFLAVTGRYLFALPWGIAVLLGGILAPTDPVLASEVQVQDGKDRDRIRTSLTGEAGMNDGSLNYSLQNLLLPALLLFLIRPAAMFSSLFILKSPREKWIISWFGVRGIGSIYYLAYAINHGLMGFAQAESVFNLVMVTVVSSIVLHGITASPVMGFYQRNWKPLRAR